MSANGSSCLCMFVTRPGEPLYHSASHTHTIKPVSVITLTQVTSPLNSHLSHRLLCMEVSCLAGELGIVCCRALMLYNSVFVSLWLLAQSLQMVNMFLPFNQECVRKCFSWKMVQIVRFSSVSVHLEGKEKIDQGS